MRRPSAPRSLDLPDDEAQEVFRAVGVDMMFAEIKQSLHDFGVDFDVYFHEDDLHKSGAVDRAVERLTELGNTYEQDGALWLATEKFGDDKDRVIIKSDGEGAYLSGDLAYYLDKRERGFDRCFIMLGADHHGYVGRMMAMCAAFGDEPGKQPRDPDRPDGQPAPRRRAAADVQARRHRGHHRRPRRARSASTPPATRWRATAPTPPSTSTSTCGPSSPATTRSTTSSTPTPGSSSILRNARRPRASRRATATTSTPRLLAHEKEGELLRALAEFPRVVASAAELREPHRVARYLEDTAGTYHRFYDNCRVLPDGRRGGRTTCTAPGCCWSPPPAPCSPTASACSASPPRSGCERLMPSHEAGWAHADGALQGPVLAARARRPQRPGPAAVVADRPQGRRRADRRRRGRCTDLVAEHGSPAYVLDEADFRARARAFRDAFAGYDVFYAGKAFLCTTVARWVAEEGLSLDVCSGGELDGRRARRLRPGPDRLPRQQQDRPPSCARAVELGVGRIVVDSFDEIERLAAITAELGAAGRG